MKNFDFKFDLRAYKSLLFFLRKEKFKFKFFGEKINTGRNIIMRHDIDFCPLRALKVAEIEKKQKIKSTYFFLINTNLYNIHSDLNKNIIRKILKMGHRIGLHFDASFYKKEIDLHKACKLELKVLENIIEKRVQIISFHRPSSAILSTNKKVAKINHTYMDKFISKIDYCSDSHGTWRYSNPQSLINRNKSKKNYCLHLLTHPIWWTTPRELNPAEKIEHHINNYSIEYKKYVSTNCKPYLNYLRSVKNK